MDRILYTLFSGDYDITPERNKNQQELRAPLFALLDQAEAALGSDFLDRLLDLGAQWAERENFQCYRSGFVLGARLMLEALGG